MLKAIQAASAVMPAVALVVMVPLFIVLAIPVFLLGVLHHGFMRIWLGADGYYEWKIRRGRRSIGLKD